MLLQGMNVLITGASSGIGKACAVECNAEGARVHLLGRDEKRLREVWDKLKNEGNSYHAMDLSETGKIENLINEIVMQYGKIGGFIHSAGYQTMAPLNALTPDHFIKIFTINTIAGFEISRHLSKKKNHSEAGLSIVFMASVMSILGESALVAYCASKAALVGGARSMAIELAPKRIRVNCISPGSVTGTAMETKDQAQLSIGEQATIASKYPLGLGATSDIANMACYLLSEKACWITGQNLVIDGGYSAR